MTTPMIYAQREMEGAYPSRASAGLPAPASQGAYPVRGVTGSGAGAQAGSLALSSAGDLGLSSGNPYGMITGGVLKAAGIGTQLWGKYKESESAEQEYERALKEYEEQKRRMERIDDIAEEQRYLQNLVGFGEYSQGLEKGATQRRQEWAHKQGV